MDRREFLGAIGAAAAGACLAGAARPIGPGVPGERLSRLARGVNVSHWLWVPERGESWKDRRAIVPAADLARLAGAGVTHVRLPIEPEDYWDSGQGAFLQGAESALMAAIGDVLAAGLAVVVDCHPRGEAWTTPEAGRFARLEAFWEDMAAAAQALDPERVFLEIMNEPHNLKDAGQWGRGQERLAQVIRAACPRHTIVATGDEWGSIDGLLRLTPLADPNVVYSFHFYEPHGFTHQGAVWGFPPWRHMKGVPWPLTRETAAPVIAATEDAGARAALEWETREPWDAARVRARIGEAAAWAERHSVPVYCGEFGVYAKFSRREARLAWLRDVTAALDAHGIGRAMWDYFGGFALAQGEPGKRTLDADVARAIGLDAD